MFNPIKSADVTPRKNTINRHYYQMERLLNLVHRGYITKHQAKKEFKKYLLESFGYSIK